MPRNRALLRSGSAVAFARLFSLVCAAVQLPLLTRFLTPGEYSEVAVAITIATYFNLLSAEPVILGFERFPGAKSDRSNYRYAMSRTLAHVTAASVVVILVALLLGRFEAAIAFAGWGVGIAVNRLISLTWLMWEEPWHYAWNLIAGTGTRTAVLIALVLVGWDPLLSLGIAGLASAVAAMIASPRLRAKGEPSVVPALEARAKEKPWPFRFGLNLAYASLGYTVLMNANLLVLTLFVSASAVGVYAVMLQVATLTSAAVLGLVLAVAYPPLRRAWDEGSRTMVQSRLRTLQIVCVAVGAGFVFIAFIADGYFLRFVFTDQYVSLPVLAPLIMGTALATMGGMASWHHQLQMESGRVARRTVVVAAAGIALTAALSVVLHERGAAIGSVVGFLIYLIVMQAGTRLPSYTIWLAAGSTIATSALVILPTASSQFVAIPAGVLCVLSLFLALRAHRRSTVENARSREVASVDKSTTPSPRPFK